MKRYYASHSLDGKPFPDALCLVRDDRFRVDVQTEAALSLLNRRAAKPGQPWFLYLAWYAPHVPLESLKPWFSKAPEYLPLKRRKALAMIAAMDDGLGQIRTRLKQMGQEQNTLIFFIGDNGAPLGDAWDGSLNLPMVGRKGMLSEGGVRVPFLAAWSAYWPAGATYDQPVINLDAAATAVALAELPHKPKPHRVNLAPFVSGENKTAPHDALLWRWGSQAAIFEMYYKLIALGEHERILFDLTKPDDENIEHNLLKQHPEIGARLETKLRTWAANLMPTGLPTTFDAHHEGLFAEHDLISKTSSSTKTRTKAEPKGSFEGWIARNGALAWRTNTEKDFIADEQRPLHLAGIRGMEGNQGGIAGEGPARAAAHHSSKRMHRAADRFHRLKRQQRHASHFSIQRKIERTSRHATLGKHETASHLCELSAAVPAVRGACPWGSP